MKNEYPIVLPAIPVVQDLGTFYVVKIPIRILMEVSYSDPFREDNDQISGIQRQEIEERRKAIRRYIKSGEAVFPNSIVLGANYTKDGFRVESSEDDTKSAWQIKPSALPGIVLLEIPSNAQLATIIDGQHRIGGFRNLISQNPDLFNTDAHLLDFEMVCSVFLDLPMSDQAFIFATINSTQKKVDRSLAYELYGFNVNNENEIYWSPEKLAIFLTRKLDEDPNSPFFNRIPRPTQNEIRPRGNALLESLGVDWVISTSSVVDGILHLITKDPAADRNKIGGINKSKKSRSVLDITRNDPPLREFYIDGDDKIIYIVLVNFFSAAKKLLWQKQTSGWIEKTVGVQALFDYLAQILPIMRINKDLTQQAFEKMLFPASNIDFSNEFFRSGGIARGRILNVLLVATGAKTVDQIHKNARDNIKEFLDQH